MKARRHAVKMLAMAVAICAVLAGCDSGHDHSGVFEVTDYRDGQPISRYYVAADDIGTAGGICDYSAMTVEVGGEVVKLSKYASYRRLSPAEITRRASVGRSDSGRTE